MTRHEEDQTSKRRILDATVQVFAEKGFDGARVDEIAKRASVNKALIYYYYPRGKEELLEVSFRETLEAAMGLLNLPEMAKFDFQDEELVKTMLNRFLDVLEERQDTLRVMLMESLKRSPVNDLIFSMIREIILKIFTALESAGAAAVGDKESAMVLEFFTGIMPLLSYVVYHEAWMERFGIGEPQLRDRFITAFVGTHFRYSATAYTNPFPMGTIAKAILGKEKE
jgi:TetR/AcrR family transcriptional regulator